MLHRSPDLLVAGVAAVIALRASLWLTTSSKVAFVIVVRLMPVWILAEALLAAGTVMCAYAVVTRRQMSLFGKPIAHTIVLPLALVGVVTILMEIALWSYALGAD